MQRRTIAPIARIRIRAISQEERRHGCESRLRCLMQRRHVRVVAGAGINPAFQPLADLIFIVGAYRGHQGGFFPSLGLHAQTGSGACVLRG